MVSVVTFHQCMNKDVGVHLCSVERLIQNVGKSYDLSCYAVLIDFVNQREL